MKAVRAIVPEDIRLCYSIKANPFLIPAMRRLVGTLEVCSPGELEICRQQGVSPDMVLFSGVNKTKADVERAMDLGVTRFTCESPLHVRLIDEAARSRGRVYPVLLRLTAGSQFGMDERDFFAALDHRAATPGIRIEGVHYFSGTQRKKLDGQRKELAMLCRAGRPAESGIRHGNRPRGIRPRPVFPVFQPRGSQRHARADSRTWRPIWPRWPRIAN